MEQLNYEDFLQSMIELTGTEDLYILYKDNLSSLKKSISLAKTLSDMYSVAGMSKIIPIPGIEDRLSKEGQVQVKAAIERIRIHLISNYNRHLRIDEHPEQDIEYKKYFLELTAICLFTFVFDVNPAQNIMEKVKDSIDEEGNTIINKVNDILKKDKIK